MPAPLVYRAVGRRLSTRNSKKFLLPAAAILAATSGNKEFASLAALIATAKADLATASEAQTACEPPNKCTATTGAFKKALNTSGLSMDQVLNGAQGVADASADGSAVLVGAGFQVKKRPVRNQAPLTLTDGASSGELLAKVKSPGRAAGRTIEIAVSADGGKTWAYDWFGPDLSHLFAGLTPGVVHLVRFRVKLLKQDFTAWSDPITIMVK